MIIVPRPLMSVGNTDANGWRAYGHRLTWLSSECYCVSTVDIHRGMGGIMDIVYFSTLDEAMSEFKKREALFIKNEQEQEQLIAEGLPKWQDAHPKSGAS